MSSGSVPLAGPSWRCYLTTGVALLHHGETVPRKNLQRAAGSQNHRVRRFQDVRYVNNVLLPASAKMHRRLGPAVCTKCSSRVCFWERGLPQSVADGAGNCSRSQTVPRYSNNTPYSSLLTSTVFDLHVCHVCHTSFHVFFCMIFTWISDKEFMMQTSAEGPSRNDRTRAGPACSSPTMLALVTWSRKNTGCNPAESARQGMRNENPKSHNKTRISEPSSTFIT